MLSKWSKLQILQCKLYEKLTISWVVCMKCLL